MVIEKTVSHMFEPIYYKPFSLYISANLFQMHAVFLNLHCINTTTTLSKKIDCPAKGFLYGTEIEVAKKWQQRITAVVV